MSDAWIVDLPAGQVPQQALFLDKQRADEYAAKHRGTVDGLVRATHPTAQVVTDEPDHGITDKGGA